MMWLIVLFAFIKISALKFMDDNLVYPVTEPLPFILFQNKCIEDLGCFYNGPPFYDIRRRPISLVPDSSFRTRYLLYTRENVEKFHELNLTRASIAIAPIDSTLPTKILVHGYNVRLETTDSRFRIKEQLLKQSSYNVIIIDWTEHNRFPYLQAVANARVVGAQVAKLILILKEVKDIDLNDVHIIGHSLGAHIAGWAGERLHTIGRISGLDPAGPYFQEAPPPVRLERSDAKFVDIIHTNGGSNFVQGYGLEETLGHLDFYPNGGKHQPGCPTNFEMIENGESDYEQLIARSCDHSRANELFMESINDCMFLSVQCTDYGAFKAIKCTRENSRVSVMGFHAKKLPGLRKWSKFYLQTAETSPFCNDTSCGP